MELTYPVFIQASDDKSIDLIETREKLGHWYEQIDVEDGLYIGWDSKAIPFTLEWQKEVGSVPRLIRMTAEPENLKQALLTYAQLESRDAPFSVPETSDMVELFRAIDLFRQSRNQNIWSKVWAKLRGLMRT